MYYAYLLAKSSLHEGNAPMDSSAKAYLTRATPKNNKLNTDISDPLWVKL